MNYQESSPRVLSVPICEKSVGSEVACEYVLPDYEEEIRRLLRVNVTVQPPQSYVGAGNASFAGALCFDLLYLSPEGKLCMAKVSEGYELSAPLEKDVDVDYSDEITAFCDVLPESVISRVLAPRKLSLKCRLRGRVRAYGRAALTEQMRGEFSPEGIERLVETADAAVFASALSEEFEVNDELETGHTGDLRVIGGEGTVHISQAQCEDGAVLCRGEVLLRIFAANGDGAPYVLRASLPFSERVEGEGFRGGMSARAYGAITELSLGESDGKVSADASFKLSAEAQENVGVPYTRDLYSTVHETEAVWGQRSYPHAAACRMGNFTQSLYEPLEKFQLESNAEVLDFSASALAEGVICDRGRWALVGESRMNLLVLSGGEYRCLEIPVPFRYEFEGECGEVESFFAELHMTGGRARVDGTKLALDCEMGVSLRLCLLHKAQMLREVTFGARVEESEECVVCFPRGGDTLWEIAKRYHTPTARLRAQTKNGDEDLPSYLIVKD